MSLTQRQKRKAVTGAKVVSLQVFFIALCLITLIPILYALSVSFNANNSLLSADFSFVPKAFTLENYKAVFTKSGAAVVQKSVIIAICTVAIALSVSFRRRTPFRGCDSAQKDAFEHAHSAQCVSVALVHVRHLQAHEPHRAGRFASGTYHHLHGNHGRVRALEHEGVFRYDPLRY